MGTKGSRGCGLTQHEPNVRRSLGCSGRGLSTHSPCFIDPLMDRGQAACSCLQRLVKFLPAPALLVADSPGLLYSSRCSFGFGVETTHGSGPGSYYPEQWNLGAGRGQAWKSFLANGKMELWTPPHLAPPGWGRASSSSSAVMYVSSEL